MNELNTNKKEYYEILDVEEDASQDEIRRAFKQLAKRFHPDLNKDDPNAEDKFIKLKEAYDTLKDPEKRKYYDRFGKQIDTRRERDYSSVVDLGEIFRTIFRQRATRKEQHSEPPFSMYI